ncbi:ABC transporter ATP-binding protein [Jannaschia seohaensis]|uniref:Peptide/nickel transport system ATP-binding protein/oligopeptide transport system ATP-binding protein n=1 Tax=Jannaschia seohaensis TaxID=475081 RepID=A0A2Y9AAX2_9RHOB|nr:ABC transporter ATP-binding protein [Jannaschia seohaensis]PWJ20905.1 peptide/nickel transport system ATP-binding protein/oligopeptide transport system ATP-binding protein [Jannaschia seohaensis]SSA41315.1 peptide/nickel transport system ATP-binding protein/oligopeptide transport system ATP-binding protein [Jannaschia seohaensis]
MTDAPLLDVEDLAVEFHVGGTVQRAVQGVSLSLARGRTLGVVGESGCGKSVTSLSIMRLVPQPPGVYAGGAIRFDGRDLLTLPEAEMRALRGGRIGMIFQEPMTSLNPVYTCGAQIEESLSVHSNLSPKAARERAIEMLDLVGLPSPRQRADDYPHQLSGGQRQRVMIALALANEPDLLIADEPTTALDVTIQAQILDLMGDLRGRTGAAVMLVTHDLGVVAQTCDDVVVMYAGRVVEKAPTAALFADPQHPYTVGLMAAVPRIDTAVDRLTTIPGSVPPPWSKITGCRFASRCPLASEKCRTQDPPLRDLSPGHGVACWHAPIEAAA